MLLKILRSYFLGFICSFPALFLCYHFGLFKGMTLTVFMECGFITTFFVGSAILLIVPQE